MSIKAAAALSLVLFWQLAQSHKLPEANVTYDRQASIYFDSRACQLSIEPSTCLMTALM